MEMWVVENGMCNRVRNGRSYDRADRWERPRYIRENLAAVVSAIDAGLPVTMYSHWSLVDNYEWGSYEPRFGIHGVDRERGVRILDTDSMGQDAAGAYRKVIDGLRAGDRSVLASRRARLVAASLRPGGSLADLGVAGQAEYPLRDLIA